MNGILGMSSSKNLLNSKLDSQQIIYFTQNNYKKKNEGTDILTLPMFLYNWNHVNNIIFSLITIKPIEIEQDWFVIDIKG